MRSRPILTAVGWARVERPYYLCPTCHSGQFPADVELDIDKTDFSPAIRRMLAVVGGEAPFTQGRDQMKLLAGLDVTAKAVERIAESIGVDIALRQQKDIQSAKQLCLPTVTGSLIPHLYIEMDGTQVFVVKSETEGRVGRTPGEPGRTRECKLGAVFARPQSMTRAGQCEMRIPPATLARLKLLRSLASGFTQRLGIEAAIVPPSASLYW
ncbi:MAG TPA: hypothetical protein VHW24_16920 [Bryobacteraceae bacterium]|nr:hypothetical protein [Bryobacteraceae bacterium]